MQEELAKIVQERVEKEMGAAIIRAIQADTAVMLLQQEIEQLKPATRANMGKDS